MPASVGGGVEEEAAVAARVERSWDTSGSELSLASPEPGILLVGFVLCLYSLSYMDYI